MSEDRIAELRKRAERSTRLALDSDEAVALLDLVEAQAKVVKRFGDHYCAACENVDDAGRAQPFHDVSKLEGETCECCRDAVQDYWNAKGELQAFRRGIGGKDDE